MIDYDHMFFAKIESLYRHIFNSTLSKEIAIFALFILTNFLTNRLLFQAIIILIYILVLYFINRNLTRTLWEVLLATILFSLGRYFPFKFTTPFSGEVEAYKVFGVSFTDAVLLGLLYWLKKSKGHIKARLSFLDLIVGIIVILSIASSYYSPHSEIAWFNLFQLLKLISLFYLSRILFWKTDYAKITIYFMLIYLTLNSFIMIAQKLHNGLLGLLVENYLIKYGNYAQDSPGLFRPGGMSWDANYSAAFLCMGFVFLVTLLVYDSKFINKKFISAMLCLFATAIVISASRGSWLVTMFVTSLIIMVGLFKKKKRPSEYLKLKIIIPVLLFVLVSGGFIVDRFYQFASEMGQSTINTRLIHLKLGFLLSLNYPLGTGPDTFQYQIMSMFEPKEYLFDSTPAHMMLGELLGDFGVLGTLAFIALFYIVLKKFWFSKNQTLSSNAAVRTGVFCMVITYLFLAQIYPLLFSFQISAIFWILLGALYEKA